MKSFFNHQRVRLLAVLIILGVNAHSPSPLHAMMDDSSDENALAILRKKPVVVLALDGGGARGLATAKILQNVQEELDKKLGQAKPLTDVFDLFAGTSTGGLIALMLASDHPIDECVNLYKTESPKIFSATWSHTLKTGNGWWGPKYDATAGLESLLDEILKETRLCEAKKPVFVTTFNPENNKLLLLDSVHAKNPEPGYNAIKMKEAARATTAAPTYFSAPILTIESSLLKDASLLLGDEWYVKLFAPLTVVDGGIGANDPAQLALSRAQELYPQRPILLVSVGTGEASLPTITRDAGLLQFAPTAINTLINGSVAATEATLEMELRHNYYRLQFNENCALDDTTLDTLKRLEDEADKVSKTKVFSNLIEKLSSIFKEE